MHIKDLKQQRWGMLTNPHYPPIEEMTKLDHMEVIQHLMILDAVKDLKPLSKSEMEQCRRRFMKFCQDQFKNRN